MCFVLFASYAYNFFIFLFYSQKQIRCYLFSVTVLLVFRTAQSNSPARLGSAAKARETMEITTRWFVICLLNLIAAVKICRFYLDVWRMVNKIFSFLKKTNTAIPKLPLLYMNLIIIYNKLKTLQNQQISVQNVLPDPMVLKS